MAAGIFNDDPYVVIFSGESLIMLNAAIASQLTGAYITTCVHR